MLCQFKILLLTHKINFSILDGLKKHPYKAFTLSGKYVGLRYLKIVHKGVMYRIVYDISEERKEVLIIFLGTREIFIKSSNNIWAEK